MIISGDQGACDQRLDKTTGRALGTTDGLANQSGQVSKRDPKV